MIRQSALLRVVFGLALQASVFGEIINVPGDQPSIQTAIDAAANGDEIVVAPGTYFENINLLGKAVTLRSSHGPLVTTVHGGSNGTVVICASGEGPDTVIDGLTFRWGVATNGGGMRIDGSSPTVTNCVFSNNLAWCLGGGMYSAGGDPTVLNCSFNGNAADRGGGLRIIDDAIIGGCTFTGNQASSTGGGVSSNGDPFVTDCIFSGNTASTGGGMYSDGDPIVTNCTFTGNNASGFGGGMQNWGAPTVAHCSFIGNSAGFGGGMSNSPGDGLITNCVFRENSATFGGAITHISSTTVVNCIIIGNSAESKGGGVFASQGASALVNCTLSKNTSLGFGGALSVGSYSAPTVTNCILWANSAPNGPEIFAPDSSALVVTNSDVQGGWPGDGNIDTDPLFVDADGPDDDENTVIDNNYSLAAGSLCIDAADNSGVPADAADLDDDGDTDEPTPMDLDGNARFVDGDENETVVVDMGAYEFQGITCPADLGGDGVVDASDLAQVLGSWGPCAGCPADLNGDSIVGAPDLAILLGAWGPCP